MAELRSRRDLARRGCFLVAILGVHLGLLWWLAQPMMMQAPLAAPSMTIVDVPAPPDPAPVPDPEPEGASAGPARQAPVIVQAPDVPTVVVPEIELPDIRLPALPSGIGGVDASSTSIIGGVGRGAGGDGSGLGGAGTGQGGGSPPRRIAGNITRGDFPRTAAGRLQASSVTIRLQVGKDGLVQACEIIRPSNNPERDAITCALARKRFRYEPARNARGEAVDAVAGWRQDWFADRP